MYHRLQSVYLAHKGRDNKEITDILGVNKNSVTKWVKIYSKKGLNELCQPINYNRRSAKIDDYIDKIKKEIKDNTISTLAELQEWIKKNILWKSNKAGCSVVVKKTPFVLQKNAFSPWKSSR